ncbi:MAG: hypothetical protein M0Z81_14105 [Deltaproteobacteria bacterium]|jgi:beta-lactamase superfamily II metal-dependent hydrolase|nr:hypothetical protein [Deltaproteobacteria bacterium]
MPIYVERTNFKPISDSGRRFSLLDTDDIRTNLHIERLLRREVNDHQPQSMLAIEYKSLPWKSLKEGSWYDIDDNTFEQFRYESVTPEMPGGAFLRAFLYGPDTPIDFTEFLTSQKNAMPPVGPLPPVDELSTNMQLLVVDCGQGNWNEILSDQNRVIYDIGASSQYSMPQVRDLVESRLLDSEARPLYVIVSHWDIDHYQGLLGCDQRDLERIRMLIAPRQVPDTSTYKRINSALLNEGVRIASIPPADRPADVGYRIVLRFHSRVGPYTFFRAVPGRSRNQTGIVISVDGPNRTAILTGDHHYEKILDAIRGNHRNMAGILVAPHHGGKAGTIDVDAWLAEFSSIETPISVGRRNPYNHPFAEVLSKLKLIQGGRAPRETRRYRNLSYSL